MSSTHQQADHPIRPVEAHRVATGARLHFGLFSPGRAAGRSFGGAGMMVDSPGTAITARPAEEFSVRGQEASGIAALADRIAQHFSRPLPLVELAVESRAPRHAGLGSGTQLAMCVAKQLVNAWRTSCDNHTLALAACRGKRSAIGIHGFEQGGFLIDAGKKDNDQIAPLIDRIEFPANWRIVLIDVSDNADGVIPSAKQRQPSFVGVSGADEAEAFDRLPPASLERTETLRREATEVLAPAVRAKNFEDFSQSVTRFNRMAGECFAPVQGGTYASQRIENLVHALLGLGVDGVGQTSWGPTVFAFCESESDAIELAATLRSWRSQDKFSAQELWIAKPRNTGFVTEG